MDNKLRLEFPTIKDKQAAWAYRQEYIDNGELHINGSGSFLQAKDYESWLQKITNALTASQTGWVNCYTYFGFIGSKIVGTIQIRETLNDSLLKSGGHIGYGVIPSERRKGYASDMLAFALSKCHDLGIERVLITCDKNNVASAKTIIKGGGIFENEAMDDDGHIQQRYWIQLSK